MDDRRPDDATTPAPESSATLVLDPIGETGPLPSTRLRTTPQEQQAQTQPDVRAADERM
ncbi:MAG: hypothetical protein IAG13_18790, partial [Deltaproteobacteria bacterium]|nr:hypothetical protein [Nannocystaceae bacterium]